MSVDSRRTSVAITGIGCRFPGGVTDTATFWRLLESGADPIGRLPAGRFDVDGLVHPEPGTPGRIVTADGGFLDGIDQFDAGFFGLSPREARKIDPQHRLLLEVAWEALEDAGIPVASLAGRRVGVYVGIWSGEYENVMYRTPAELDFHSITGGGRYAASGRISFAFDLRGPAMTVDTGCSASLVALHLAQQAIENGEADLAIVGAANLVLQPHVNIGYSRSGMLSAGARCRFGDAAAAGYVRSDAAAAIVLKPLDAAQRDGDPVRGVLLATGVNADGKGSGQLATPSADAQAELLETVYARGGIDPRMVAYVEAHGTGTRAGDPVELEALGRVLGRDRSASAPLIVGSVKSNIGHTEAAAGMAGLIKTLLILEHRRIPANLHLDARNETIPWSDLHVEIPAAARDWPAGMPLVAGVSSFGITGTNAHAVVAAAPVGAVEVHEERPCVVTVSGRSAAALSAAAVALRDWSAQNRETVTLGALSWTTTCRRDHHDHRLAVVADSWDDVVAGLDDHFRNESQSRAIAGVAAADAPTVGFIFSGQGSQWLGMGRELLMRAPVFAEWIHRCDAGLRSLTDWSLLDVLNGDDAAPLERVDVIQPALACFQIALAEQIRSWGIEPRGVAGHSMGEVAAAFSAGALTLEDALRIIVVRSRLLAGIAGRGAMALVDLDEAETAELIRNVGDRVSVAAVNGPRSTVISGDPATVVALLERLDDDGVFCRRVKVDVASHSAQTDVLLPRLREELRALKPVVPHAAFHSTARPGTPVDQLLDAGYWVDNLRHPVQLVSAVRAMVDNGIDTFIEIAPHPVLLSALADIAAVADARVRTLAGPRRDEPEFRRCLDLLARLHVNGAPVSWSSVWPSRSSVVRLPSYPWQRERHWLDVWEDWSGDSTARSAVARPERVDELGYTVEWRSIELETQSVPMTGAWLVIGAEHGVTRHCVDLIRARGAQVFIARNVKDVPATVQRIEESKLGVSGVIVLDVLTQDDVSGDGTACTVAALEAAQSLISAGVAAPTWWVTRTAQSLSGRTASPDGWKQAGVWGLVRTLWQEHPETDAHLIDIDAGQDDVAAMQIVHAICDISDEPQIAFAGETAHAARLVRAAGLRTPMTLRADAAYLITGGLGALGLIAAEEMVRAGARRLILMSRTPMPPRSEWRSLSPGLLADRAAGVLRLEALGASVHIAAVDAADPESVEAWLQSYRAESWPSICGIVHCAGTLDNQLIRVMSPQSLRELMRGKASAAANLAALLPDVERTIYFSSITAILPQAGQANYAAANAALDAMAAQRDACGRATASVAWGVWTGTGLVANERVHRYVETMEREGLGSIEPEEGRALFHWAGVSGAPYIAIVPVAWGTARERLANRPGAPFYSDLLGASSADTAGPTLRDTILELPDSQRRAVLLENLRAIVARVLDVQPTSVSIVKPLGRQGLDSLMALEFRNRLENGLKLRLPASLTWNHPTLERMTDHLLDRIAPQTVAQTVERDVAAATATATSGLDARVRAEVSELSDEEALAQIRAAG